MLNFQCSESQALEANRKAIENACIAKGISKNNLIVGVIGKPKPERYCQNKIRLMTQ